MVSDSRESQIPNRLPCSSSPVGQVPQREEKQESGGMRHCQHLKVFTVIRYFIFMIIEHDKFQSALFIDSATMFIFIIITTTTATTKMINMINLSSLLAVTPLCKLTRKSTVCGVKLTCSKNSFDIRQNDQHLIRQNVISSRIICLYIWLIICDVELTNSAAEIQVFNFCFSLLLGVYCYSNWDLIKVKI